MKQLLGRVPGGTPGRLGTVGAVVLSAIAALAVGASLAPTARGAGGPKNTALPTIGGTAQAGQTLTATTGTWTGTGVITYQTQWQRCDSSGGACADLPSSFGRSSTLTLGSADVNHTLRVEVSASDATGGPVVATSAATALVSPAPVGAPAATAPPAISGAAQVGKTLTATTGTWTGIATIAYAYAWQRCDATGGACNAIAGATAATYKLADADAGSTLRVVVTASNPAGAASATSVPSAEVPGSPNGIVALPNGGKSVDANDIKLPDRLAIAGVSFAPPELRNHAPFTLRVTIKDSRGYVVRNALVYALGVPYSRVALIPETKTGNDGTVSFTVHPLPGLKIGKGQYLVVFIRARRSGDPLNGGVSIRRLVQVHAGPSA
jgi:hypothetical protein